MELHTIGPHKSQRTLCKILNEIGSKHLSRKVLGAINDFRSRLNVIKKLLSAVSLFPHQKSVLIDMCRLLYKNTFSKIRTARTTEEIKTFWACSIKCILLDFEQSLRCNNICRLE